MILINVFKPCCRCNFRRCRKLCTAAHVDACLIRAVCNFVKLRFYVVFIQDADNFSRPNFGRNAICITVLYCTCVKFHLQQIFKICSHARSRCAAKADIPAKLRFFHRHGNPFIVGREIMRPTVEQNPTTAYFYLEGQLLILGYLTVFDIRPNRRNATRRLFACIPNSFFVIYLAVTPRSSFFGKRRVAENLFRCYFSYAFYVIFIFNGNHIRHGNFRRYAIFKTKFYRTSVVFKGQNFIQIHAFTESCRTVKGYVPALICLLQLNQRPNGNRAF